MGKFDFRGKRAKLTGMNGYLAFMRKTAVK